MNQPAINPSARPQTSDTPDPSVRTTVQSESVDANSRLPDVPPSGEIAPTGNDLNTSGARFSTESPAHEPPQEQSRGAEPIDFTRRLHEVERLAGTDLEEDVFFARWLQLTSEPNGAVAAAVWMVDPHGRVGLMAEDGLSDIGLHDQSPLLAGNVDVIIDALRRKSALVHTPGETGQVKLPTQHIQLLVPVLLGEKTVGVCQQFLPLNSPPEQRLEQLQFLEESAVMAGRYLQWRDEATSAPKQLTYWNRFDAFVNDLHRTLHPHEVALTAVNDGRQLLGSDRVSLILKRGTRTNVVAVSGQDRIRKRSNVIRALRALSVAVLRGGQTVTYAGSLEDVPPPLERLVTDYVQESGCRMVRLIPLKTPQRLIDLRPTLRRPRIGKTFGVLVVEQTDDGWLTPLAEQRADRLAEHTAVALHNARTHHGVFLLPVRKALGSLGESLRGRTLLWLAVVLAVLGCAGAALALIPGDYRVEGTGKLMPALQRDVFAYWEGEVEEIYVRSGQQVKAGQPLLRIRNDDWNARMVEMNSLREEKQQLLIALTEEYRAAGQRGEQAEEIRLRGKAAQTTVEIRGLTERMAALQTQVDRLTQTSPIDGTVATFQLEQLLMHRKVKRGEKLLEVMDEEGDWRLELEVPENRLGHLLTAQANSQAQQKNQKRSQSATPATLPVDFVLATRPEADYEGRLQTISSRVTVTPDNGAAVKVHVAVNRDQLPDRHIGAEVAGKIHCGQRSMFYVLFGDVVEFVQRKWW